MARTLKSVRRILVALNAPIHNLETLNTAAALADQMRAELDALLIENTDLVNLGGLPFARELDAQSGIDRPLERDWIDRRIQAHVKQVQKLLEAVRRDHDIVTRFEIIRGDYLSAALDRGSRMDVTFLEGGRRLSFALRGASSKPTRSDGAGARPLYGSVTVLFNNSVAAERAVKVAEQIATALKRRLVVVVVPGENGPESNDLKKGLRTCLQEPHRVVTRVAASEFAADVMSCVAAERAELLIVPREMNELVVHRTAPLRRAFDCSVVLVA